MFNGLTSPTFNRMDEGSNPSGPTLQYYRHGRKGQNHVKKAAQNPAVFQRLGNSSDTRGTKVRLFPAGYPGTSKGVYRGQFPSVENVPFWSSIRKQVNQHLYTERFGRL